MLFWYELKKSLFQPMVIGLLILCLLVNGVLIMLTYNDFQSDRTIERENIYVNFQAEELANHYIQKYSVTGENADNIRSKYEKVQQITEQKAQNEEALALYFGEQTPYQHSNLFGLIFSIIIAQVSLLALFSGLLSVTYEQIRGTESIVYASKVGRQVLRIKLYATLASTLLMSTALIGISLLIYFLRVDFSGVWTDFVSSAFNSAVHEFGKPFITWSSLTVGTYTWATIALTIGLGLCFGLLGYISGVFVRNSTGAFMTVALIIGVFFLVKYLLPIGSISRAILGMTPVWLWKTNGEWFTDGGADILWRNFETIGLFSSLFVLSLLVFVSRKVFEKKEIV